MIPREGHPLLPAPGSLPAKCLIIGSGVAGLQVARQMSQLDWQVLVLEASHDIGGVWMQNYVGYSLQVPWRMYQFPEFLWPPELQPAEEYPSGQQVQAYIRAYAARFGLMRHIRLHCKLLRLRWDPACRTWDALYCNTETEKFFKVTADYVVMCSGLYSNPYIPAYTGADKFEGVQLHAKDFTDMSVVRGQRVLIVGSGKTALDCVCGVVASRTAASVTMLYRKAHWPVPRNVLGIPVRKLMFNRAMSGMLQPYYTAGAVRKAAQVLMEPLKRLFWRSLECFISHKFDMATKLQPQTELPEDLFYGGQILDDRIDEHMRSEELDTIRGEINSFVRNGVILQDGSFRPVDVVLYCTGYEKTYEYFDGEMRSRLGLQKDGLYLYRQCLSPGVPHLAFVGCEVSTYNNILTHGLQALWLAHVLGGRVRLPPPAAMAEDVRAQQRWRRDVMPVQRCRGSVLMLYMQDYHDQLLRDLRTSPWRKGLNPLAECFASYSAEDYQRLMTSCNTRRWQRAPQQQPGRERLRVQEGIKCAGVSAESPPASSISLRQAVDRPTAGLSRPDSLAAAALAASGSISLYTSESGFMTMPANISDADSLNGSRRYGIRLANSRWSDPDASVSPGVALDLAAAAAALMGPREAPMAAVKEAVCVDPREVPMAAGAGCGCDIAASSALSACLSHTCPSALLLAAVMESAGYGGGGGGLRSATVSGFPALGGARASSAASSTAPAAAESFVPSGAPGGLLRATSCAQRPGSAGVLLAGCGHGCSHNSRLSRVVFGPRGGGRARSAQRHHWQRSDIVARQLSEAASLGGGSGVGGPHIVQSPLAPLRLRSSSCTYDRSHGAVAVCGREGGLMGGATAADSAAIFPACSPTHSRAQTSAAFAPLDRGTITATAAASANANGNGLLMASRSAGISAGSSGSPGPGSSSLLAALRPIPSKEAHAMPSPPPSPSSPQATTALTELFGMEWYSEAGTVPSNARGARFMAAGAPDGNGSGGGFVRGGGGRGAITAEALREPPQGAGGGLQLRTGTGCAASTPAVATCRQVPSKEAFVDAPVLALSLTGPAPAGLAPAPPPLLGLAPAPAAAEWFALPAAAPAAPRPAEAGAAGGVMEAELASQRQDSPIPAPHAGSPSAVMDASSPGSSPRASLSLWCSPPVALSQIAPELGGISCLHLGVGETGS